MTTSHIIVDTLLDENSNPATTSLRDAINLVDSGGTITFSPDLMNQDSGFGQGTIGLTLGELVVDKSLTIDGLGADQLTISGNEQFRIFLVEDDDSNSLIDVSINNLKITDGISDEISSGAGILSRENLEISNSEIIDNQGHAIASESPYFVYQNLSIQNSTLSGNGESGILLQNTSLDISNSDVSTNQAGGISISFRSPSIEVRDTVINNNGGFGIGNTGSSFGPESLIISDSTISNNQSGGISLGDRTFTYTLDITDSIITGNQGDGIAARSRGGIEIKDTLISENSGIGINNLLYSIDSGGDPLTVINSTVSRNSDGIVSGFFSNVDIIDSQVLDNYGDGVSGGLLDIQRSTISGNEGVGITPKDFSGRISDSTVANNFGGGIVNIGAGDGNSGIYTRSMLFIQNSTISGNGNPLVPAGGILNARVPDNFINNSSARPNAVIVENSTITGNVGAVAGGIVIEPNAFFNYEAYYFFEPSTLQNTIVAGNFGANPDISGPLQSQGNNLVGDGSGTTDPLNGPGDLVGDSANPIDPLLAPLADNGGPTLTQALLPGSPAIDAGDPNFAASLEGDQRGAGFPRVTDGNLDGIARVDIGALELQPLTIGIFDADTDTLITTLANGSEILASDLVNVNATIAAFVPEESRVFGRVESVFLDLNDGEITRTENFEPYALFGDTSGDFFGGLIPIGTNSIALDLYSQNGLNGDFLGTITRDFTVVNDLEPDLEIGLFDTDSDTLITLIEDRDEILGSLVADKNVTIAAFVPDESVFFDQVESVALSLNNGEVERVENFEPYALFGDKNGDFFDGSLSAGLNTISFDLFTEDGLNGDFLGTISRDFTILES